MHKIETQRLILKPLRKSDVSQMYVDWLNDKEVNQFLETRHTKQTIESCEQFVENCCNDTKNVLFGVFLKETGQHIGNAKLGFIDWVYQTGQISLFVGEKSLWGKGLAYEIVSSLTRYGFDELKLERIEAGCYEENLGSLRVFLKVGYTIEGFKRRCVTSNGKRVGAFWKGILKNEFN